MGDQKTACITPAKKPVVVVTGFGPFGSHKVNASSVAVHRLQEEGLHNDDVELVVSEMPVEYDAVQSIVPKLWQQHNPLLVVHVGVSGIATKLMMEQQAHNSGYDKTDITGCWPQTQCCVNQCDKDCVLVSGICMNKVCSKVNSSEISIKAKVSNDAGRYLCEFSYFSSLHINQNSAAFIHVPPLDCPYSLQELVEGLRVAINAMIQQVQSR